MTPSRQLQATPKILYLMHVDWRWIKQRPQFLAEALMEHYEVLVMDRKCIVPGVQLTTNRNPVGRRSLLPTPWRWQAARWFTVPSQRAWVSVAASRFKPDTIWLTHPALLEGIPGSCAGLPIVYDCMDDVLGFPASDRTIAFLARLERELVERAALILCSSSRLRDLLISRNAGVVRSKLVIVRNAISSSLLDRQSVLTARSQENRVRIGYFGTIADWLDFDALLAGLNQNQQLEFHLVGPTLIRAIPRHDRLKVHRPVPHEDLAQLSERFDAFVMPFRLNGLTASVDPVKLYEYLAFGKEIITVQYAEIDQFAPFVHFYQNVLDFLKLLDRLTTNTLERKNLGPDRSAFLSQNTWEARCAQILRVLPLRLQPVSA